LEAGFAGRTGRLPGASEDQHRETGQLNGLGGQPPGAEGPRGG
jgi:hypothetical protein